MKLSLELLDYIFSFLVSDRGTLIACSRDPVLSQIVERHLYYFITVYIDDWGRWECLDNDDFGPVRLSNFISENPRILHYVRILKIYLHIDHFRRDLELERKLNQFAETLLMFPALECIKLNSSRTQFCNWPDGFRAALEDRLNLPTLKELHIEGNHDFPCSLIDNRKNIENLLLSGSFQDAKRKFCCSNLPQLKSLTLLSRPFHPSFLPSIKHHINELQSLKCVSSAVTDLPELLGVCSQTLNELDIDLFYTSYYRSYMQTGEVDGEPLPELSIPPNLQRLTIRARITLEYELYRPYRCNSHLPASAEIINLFAGSLRHLVLDIDICLPSLQCLTQVDFSPLAVLGAASLSIPRIDLYIHTDTLPSADTLARLLSSLADYNDISKSIKDGTLVIHSEETAPEYAERPF